MRRGSPRTSTPPPRELFSGEIGELHGVRFVETTEAKIYRGENLASEQPHAEGQHEGGRQQVYVALQAVRLQ